MVAQIRCRNCQQRSNDSKRTLIFFGLSTGGAATMKYLEGNYVLTWIGLSPALIGTMIDEVAGPVSLEQWFEKLFDPTDTTLCDTQAVEPITL